MATEETLIGPFTQLLTMDGLASAGPLRDTELEIIPNAGVTIRNGIITEIGQFQQLRKKTARIHEIPYDAVALPGFIDAHTHICFAGTRASDYAKRLGGMSYLEIASQGGGILDTVNKTRAATLPELINMTAARLNRQHQHGITTCEIKSGYGLTVEDEIKILKAIQGAAQLQPIDVIPTCLAAHVLPKDFNDRIHYLKNISETLFPVLRKERLTNRVDIFVDEGTFSVEEAREYLSGAKTAGFSICIHADQFNRGGAKLAAELQALSADHLEKSTPQDFQALKENKVIPIVLPGSSMGLGLPYPRAREMLDCGLPLVIASDWNPGSAPMGNLLLQAAVLGAAEHLSMAETFAAITVRAAQALELNDRGSLKVNRKADLAIFPCSNYQEILYNQGSLLPKMVICNGL